jgi:alpha-1,6-mannosyltransferase
LDVPPVSGAPERRAALAAIRGRGFEPLALLLVAGMAAATALIVVDGAAQSSPLIPLSPRIAGYLKSVGGRLNYDPFLIALLAFTACYGGVLWCARRLSTRFAIAALVALHAIAIAGPILLSQDIFSYVAYARMGVEHGVNPYVHGPTAIAHDPIFRYVGVHWKGSPTAYGPLFTLLSYPLAPLGIIGAIWSFKLLAALASLAMIAMTGLCARRLDRNPVPAMLIVGLNPLTVLYDVGGAHNDLWMAALMMLGVWLALGRREAAGAASVVAGAAIKATAAAVLPFMVLGRRRLAPIGGALAAAVAVALASYLAFGVHALDFVAQLRRDASFVSTDSFPNEVAHLFGKPGVFPVDRQLLHVALAAVVLYIAWRVWRGYDWIAGSGWTMLGIAVTTTWLLAWYVLWALPLAAISRDRRLIIATLAVQGFFIVHQVSPLLSPV